MHCQDAVLQFGGDPFGVDRFADCKRNMSLHLSAKGSFVRTTAADKNKKTDVVEDPEVFDHVGLLINEPPGRTGLLFI